MAAGNKRNTRTTHPKQSARRQRALDRFKPATDKDIPARRERKEQEYKALVSRIGKPPRMFLRAADLA